MMLEWISKLHSIKDGIIPKLIWVKFEARENGVYSATRREREKGKDLILEEEVEHQVFQQNKWQLILEGLNAKVSDFPV